MPLGNDLHIIALYKNGSTFLKHSYCRHPFKIANITEDKSDCLLRLMITSSSPGILDNDNYKMLIEIEGNAKVYLTTQSYQRLFSMANTASQKMNIYVKNNGTLFFMPHPSVPHKASDFSSINNIYLNKNHNLIWSEIITCGRKLSGEEFLFTKFQNVTNIYINNKIVLKETILLEPSKKNVHAIGSLEGYTHQATLLVISNTTDVEKIYDMGKELVSGIDGIISGISMLPVGLLFRMLGHKAEVLFNCNKKLASLVEQQLTNHSSLISL